MQPSSPSPVASASAPGDGTLDLDAIEARANAATWGPWTHFHRGKIDEVQFSARHPVAAWPGFDGLPNATADAAFIAAARTDVPALCAALRAERERGDERLGVPGLCAEVRSLRALLRADQERNNATLIHAQAWVIEHYGPDAGIAFLRALAPTGSEARGDR